MPYGEDDSVELGREMSNFAYMEKTDSVSACLRDQYMAQVYGLSGTR